MSYTCIQFNFVATIGVCCFFFDNYDHKKNYNYKNIILEIFNFKILEYQILEFVNL